MGFSPTVEIVPFQASVHEAAAFTLWNRLFRATWPLNADAFRARVLTPTGASASGEYVALDKDTLVGFAAWQFNGQNMQGQITVLFVATEYQGRGIGTRLLRRVLDALKPTGAKTIHLGSGAGNYLFPGVPTNLPDAVDWFARRGWPQIWESADMVLDTAAYQQPDFVQARVDGHGIKFNLAQPDDWPEVIAFEHQHFPEWAGYYESTAFLPAGKAALIAWNMGGKIVGTLMMEPHRVWSTLLPMTADIGAVGVAEHARKTGIGLALVSEGIELLKERGVEQVYLSWVWLVDWYSKLGFQVWRHYSMRAAAPEAITLFNDEDA